MSSTLTTTLLRVPQVTIHRARLLDSIHTTARFGAKNAWGTGPTETGVCRLALSDEDLKVRNWFVEETKKLGCEVKIDDMGNIFAIYPGENPGAPTAMGSHLDTQPSGGRYDGILGVLGGLEVLRTIHENKIKPRYPIAVVDWTNEEGARFPVSMVSSSVWAGAHTKESGYALESITESDAPSLLSELKRIGYMGDIPCSYESIPLAAHFELHIEQGPILEQSNKRIGLVQGIQAYKWLDVTITGKAQHTGTTPLSARSDALLTASKLVVLGNEIAIKHGGLFSVGVLNVEPGVVNVIPETCHLTIDMRHRFDKSLAAMHSEFFTTAESIVTQAKTFWKSHELTDQPAVHFHDTCKACIKDASDELWGPTESLPIVSGAGHDSGPVSIRCPTAMIFVPSRDGVSHNPAEYTSPEQCADGCQVLLGAVLRFDQQRQE